MEDRLHTEPVADVWFPYTKLQAPPPSDNYLGRPQLQVALVEAVRRHRLTLIAAPAGSGKTLLAATLAASEPLTLWLALDTADDDFHTFVALLIASMRSWLEDTGRSLLTFIQTVPNAHEKPTQLGAILINSLRHDARFPAILILDDYHVITEPAIHQLVAYLIDYLPDSLRILIATRHDPPLPLPRLRARGQLAEFRLSQMRFDTHETALFLNQRHRLALSEAEVTALQRRTEGWIAGLQLLAMVLIEIDTHEARLRYIHQLGPFNRSIFDLLASEVLEAQPPEIQEFLLQTSILAELTSESCRAVTGDPDAPQLLATIYRRNLFISALTPDTHDGPFRYHDLFSAFLQLRLRTERPDQWRELHRRAAQIAAISTERRLAHLTAAELWDEAAQLLEQMGQRDTERRFTRRSVILGIEALPEPVRLSHPWLLLFVGQYYAIRGQVETADRWLAQAAARFEANGDELGSIEILAARAMTDVLDTASVVIAFQQKLAAVPHLFRSDHYVVYHGVEMWHAVANQDWPSLTSHLHATITMALQSGDPGALTMANLTIGPQMLFNDEEPGFVEALALHSLRHAGAEDWILRICSNALLGYIRFLQGRVEPAKQSAREAYHLLESIGGLAWIDDHVCWLLLSLALAMRDYRAFDDLYATQTARWATQATSASYRQGFFYLQGRSLWLRNRFDEAHAVLSQMQADTAQSGYEHENQMRQLLMTSLLAISSGDMSAAERNAQQAITLHRQVRHTVLLSHPRLTLASLYARQRRWSEALEELGTTLDELRARETPGVILQEGESIVPLLAYAVEQGFERELLEPLLHIVQPDTVPRIIAIPDSQEYLTAREAEVLRLLATGVTNPTIATELSITERTVKAHVTRILAKLGATTRTEAVTKAMQLSLI